MSQGVSGEERVFGSFERVESQLAAQLAERSR